MNTDPLPTPSAPLPKVYFVIGPTASGKSAKAIELAHTLGGKVISVDSRQVYRTLDIGTEKLSSVDMEDVPHHLIDILEPEDSYSAGDFVADAMRLIPEIQARGHVAILAGGTHFYFDALLYGVPVHTPVDPALRKRLEARTERDLFEELSRRDARRAHTIDSLNKRRLVRALEILESEDAVPERSEIIFPYPIEWVVIDPERDVLRERLHARLAQTLERGLIEEVCATRERVGDARLNELGLEYRIVGEYLRGELLEEDLVPTLESKLWQYAKRQKMWIRKLTKPTSVNSSTLP